MRGGKRFDPDGSVGKSEVVVRSEREIVVIELADSIAVIRKGVSEDDDLEVQKASCVAESTFFGSAAARAATRIVHARSNSWKIILSSTFLVARMGRFIRHALICILQIASSVLRSHGVGCVIAIAIHCPKLEILPDRHQSPTLTEAVQPRHRPPHSLIQTTNRIPR